MTAGTGLAPGTVRRPAALLRRGVPGASALLVVAAVAWVLTVRGAAAMGGAAPGRAGLSLPAFLVAWSLMMTAMMLPAVAPVATLYARTVRGHRGMRLAAFTVGYLLVWTAAGVPAFVLADAAGRLAGSSPVAARVAAVVVFTACGLYQLTSWKDRCLQHCRSPLSLLLQYGSYRGRGRDLAAGAHHGAYCAGCCWALFAVLLAVGVMNLPAMLLLTVVVLLEKLWSRGVGVARAVGVAALVLAALVAVAPQLAPGLHAPAGGTTPMRMG